MKREGRVWVRECYAALSDVSLLEYNRKKQTDCFIPLAGPDTGQSEHVRYLAPEKKMGHKDIQDNLI